MLFTDFILAFNTIIAQQLIGKLDLLRLNTSTCNRILVFLTDGPQTVQVGNIRSNTITLSTAPPPPRDVC